MVTYPEVTLWDGQRASVNVQAMPLIFLNHYPIDKGLDNGMNNG